MDFLALRLIRHAKTPSQLTSWLLAFMTVKRLRGRALQRMRSQVLTDNPLCVICENLGRVTVASEVDHIQALTNGGVDSVLNMQGLCAQCHADKTRADLGQEPRAVFDENGRVKW